MSPSWSTVKINPLFNSSFLLQVFIRQCWSSAELGSQMYSQHPCRVQQTLLNGLLLGQGSFRKHIENVHLGKGGEEKAKAACSNSCWPSAPMAVIPTASCVHELVVVNAAGKAQLQRV